MWPDIPRGTGEDLTSSDRPWGRGEGRVWGHGGSPAQGGGEGGRDDRGGDGTTRWAPLVNLYDKALGSYIYKYIFFWENK